ncbi:MAG: PAS domain S-box protein [Chitinivibrionales bacterium]
MPSKKTSGIPKPADFLKQYQDLKRAKESLRLKTVELKAAQRELNECRRTEEALRESEERFSKAFKTSPYAYMIANMEDGAILEVNDAFTTISGFSREEALASSTLNLKLWVNEEDRKRMVATLRNGRPVVGLETKLCGKSGNVITVSLCAQEIRIKQRTCVISIIEDITDRKKAQQQIADALNYAETVFEASPIGIVTYEECGKAISANSAAATIVGSSNEQVRKQNFRELESWERSGLKDAALAALALNEEKNIEVHDVSTFGKESWLAVRFVPFMHQGRKELLTMLSDITERKRADEALAAEKERLAVTLRSIGDAVIATDVRGNILLMNNVAEMLTGWPFDEAEGRPLSDVFNVINELTHESLENPVDKVISSGKIIELANHTLLVSRDGAERVIADSGAPIKNKNGKTIGVVLVFRDITEKQKFMDAIQHTAKLESLGILAGGIAHDFNNLLTGIFGYIDLARTVSKEAKIKEYLESTLASMHRARALTLQLLTFSKGGSPVQKTTQIIPFVQEAVEFALSGSNISYRFDLAEDLRPCNIDKDQIGQVIDNIVINAEQAMPGGGDIEISARNFSFGEKEHPQLAKGDYVKVSIKDHGIGIPKDILPRIFDPFYTTKIKGHGLGLATCHSIINRHGGCIEVESEQGRGSTFHVYLPASLEAVVASAAAIVKHRGSGTIIVMDDEDDVRSAVREVLESLGYAVACKNDGREALDFFISETKAGRTFAAVIFDLTVPGGMGGVEAVREIRKLNKVIPVFVASGYADNSVMRNPAEHGFTASISKPFTIAELSEMLNRNVKSNE